MRTDWHTCPAAATTFQTPRRSVATWLPNSSPPPLLFAASAARAETFDVAVRVFCPAAWNTALDRLDETFGTRVDMPCAGIRVVAMDADPLRDEYCGAAYTDSRGVARFRGSCNDTAGGRPEVYLKVEGRSANGFSVGVIDPNPLERILESLGRIFEVGVPLPLPVIDRLRAHRLSRGSATNGWPVKASGSTGATSRSAAGSPTAASRTWPRASSGPRITRRSACAPARSTGRWTSTTTSRRRSARRRRCTTR